MFGNHGSSYTAAKLNAFTQFFFPIILLTDNTKKSQYFNTITFLEREKPDRTGVCVYFS